MGVCIANDAYKVLQDHNVSVKALEDLSELANKKLDDPKKWSLASLTEKLLAKQVFWFLSQPLIFYILFPYFAPFLAAFEILDLGVGEWGFWTIFSLKNIKLANF